MQLLIHFPFDHHVSYSYLFRNELQLFNFIEVYDFLGHYEIFMGPKGEVWNMWVIFELLFKSVEDK